MKARSKWNTLAATAGISALLSAAALVPSAQAAGQRCGNRTELVQVGGETATPRTIKEFAKDISAQGLSCNAAYKFLGLLYHDKTQTTPEHFKCTTARFKAPPGYAPFVCTHHAMKVEYATQVG